MGSPWYQRKFINLTNNCGQVCPKEGQDNEHFSRIHHLWIADRTPTESLLIDPDSCHRLEFLAPEAVIGVARDLFNTRRAWPGDRNQQMVQRITALAWAISDWVEEAADFLISGWWFQTLSIFHTIWDSPSHWLSSFSRWLKPPTSYKIFSCAAHCRVSDGWKTSPKKHPTEFSGKGHPQIHRFVTMIPAEPR